MKGDALLGRLSISRWVDGKPVRLWVLLSLVGAVLYLGGLANHHLWGAQEPYVGGIVREMADSGNWVVPTLNGVPYLEKPPLYYAVGALAVRLFHRCDPWVLRLPSALFALATLFWIAWLGCRRRSPAAGWWAAFCLASSDLYFRIGHTAIVDMALTFSVALGLGFVWLLYEEPEHLDRWANGLGLALGLAFLAKGVVGPLLVLLPLAVAQALPGWRLPLGRLLRPRWGALCGLLLVAGWLILLYRQGGWPYLDEAMVRNTLGRFLQSARWTPATGMQGEHRESLGFYLTHSPFNLLPWLVPAAAAVVAACRRSPGRRPGDRFLVLALGLDILFLSVSRMRRAIYFMPLIPSIFLLTGGWLDDRFRRAEADGTTGSRGLAVLLGVTGTPIILAALAGPWLLARDHHLPWAGPLGFSFLAAGLGLAGVVALVRRRPRVAFDVLTLAWAGGLLWLVFVLPVVRDARLRRLEGSFRTALQVAQASGAQIRSYGLSEADLGMASLIIRKPVPAVPSLEVLAGLLAQEGPQVVLALPDPQEAALAVRCRGRALQSEPAANGQQGTRLLVLVNAAVCRKLPETLVASDGH